MLSAFWWMLVGHAAADFWAQGETMAKAKNRHWPDRPPIPNFPPWYYWLATHALMHGGAVALATQSVQLGGAEMVAHALIDAGKCEGWYGFHTDQLLHVACKLVWAAIATGALR